jgi:hypothetical protein
MYMGIEKSMQASCMPPIAKNVFFDPLDSNQCGKNSENMKPCKISRCTY